ncbi:hypothetical protein PISMIDRAFT_400042 [Pisolithus microcarpus 441]|uniref:Uncharacterized protein n=1 Tax=Pisolithus microcarpus 441 TaxID=765257 RepID=A0A0C9YTE5_9AGAM|nr:hypothetical protein PISMIDRAFT_400042 [Pisolithus microcarpus 441]
MHKSPQVGLADALCLEMSRHAQLWVKGCYVIGIAQAQYRIVTPGTTVLPVFPCIENSCRCPGEWIHEFPDKQSLQPTTQANLYTAR